MRDKLEALRARRADIAREIKLLSDEDSELAVAETVFLRLSGEHAPVKERASHKLEPDSPGTQREYVLWALNRSPQPWISSGEIIAMVSREWGVTIPERSLRPLLSVMKREGEISRQGRTLASRERARAARGAASDRR